MTAVMNKRTPQAAAEQANDWPFRSVLVANRGEIAVRILRTVQSLGLRGMAVNHAADRDSPAVRLADQAIEIVGKTPVDDYLDGAQFIAAADKTGTVSIHPRFGLMSANSV